MYIEELLNKVTEPADLAIFLLGFSVGFIIDGVYFSGGVPSGTIAGIIAIGLLGLKKGVDAYFLASHRIAKKLRKKKLQTLRNYFLNNPRATQVINDMESILDAHLVDYNLYDQLLDTKLQKYIITSLKEVEQFKGEQQNLYDDFLKLYHLAKSPEENKEELEDFCQDIGNLYFPPKQTNLRKGPRLL